MQENLDSFDEIREMIKKGEFTFLFSRSTKGELAHYGKNFIFMTSLDIIFALSTPIITIIIAIIAKNFWLLFAIIPNYIIYLFVSHVTFLRYVTWVSLFAGIYGLVSGSMNAWAIGLLFSFFSAFLMWYIWNSIFYVHAYTVLIENQELFEKFWNEFKFGLRDKEGNNHFKIGN